MSLGWRQSCLSYLYSLMLLTINKLVEINKTMSHLPPGRSLKQSPFHLLLNSLLSLIGEKIWIQCDDTEEDVATDLLEAGVPKEDIVLGFRQPFPILSEDTELLGETRGGKRKSKNLED